MPVPGRCPECGACGWPGYGQNPSGDRDSGASHPAPPAAGTVPLHYRTGQCHGTGEAGWAAGADSQPADPPDQQTL